MIEAVLTPAGLFKTRGSPGPARPVPAGGERDRLMRQLDDAHMPNDADRCMACGHWTPCPTRVLLRDAHG